MRAWLIQGQEDGVTVYWAVRKAECYWEPDRDKAIRFADKKSAQAMTNAYAILSRMEGKPVLHTWIKEHGTIKELKEDSDPIY